MSDPTKTHRRDTVVEMLKLMSADWPSVCTCACVLVVRVKMELEINHRSSLCTHLLCNRGKFMHTGPTHTHILLENGRWMDGLLAPLTSSRSLCSAGTGQSWGTPAPVISGSHSSLQCCISLWLPPKCQTPTREWRIGKEKSVIRMYLSVMQGFVPRSQFKATICIFWTLKVSIQAFSFKLQTAYFCRPRVKLLWLLYKSRLARSLQQKHLLKIKRAEVKTWQNQRENGESTS